MSAPYLTKSDFKACLHCRTKLYYRKRHYPSNLDDNEYLRFLADGGFMAEFIAKAHFPRGIDLVGERDPVAAFARTSALLAQGDVTLFEAAATVGPFHVRTDILKREGNVLHLIEVKSSSLGAEDDWASPFITKKGEVAARWRDHVMDVAFQTHVLRLAFPSFSVRPQLCVIDKRHPVTANETLDRFSLAKDPANSRSRPKVIYRGDLSALAQSKAICFRSVAQEIEQVMPEVVRKAEALAALLTTDGVIRFQEDIGERYQQCRVCEYRMPGGQGDKNGFRECWGKLAEATPHLLDLHRVGQIGGASVADPVPALLQRGRASLLDLDPADLGAEGSFFRERRLLQWQSMQDGGVEHLPPALRRELQAHRQEPGWPLHFIDFEACDMALPHHAGLRPYERVAFQWSCHTMQADGRIAHAEWLNPEKAFPNFAFAHALRRQLGEQGTVYVWSPYEQTTLRRVLHQIAEWRQREPDAARRSAGAADTIALDDLADWIDRFLGPEDENGKRHPRRIRDLHDLARRHYFHPRMGGRTSIKVVLPAVWEANKRLWQHPEFNRYYRQDAAGKPMDPYKTLPALPLGEKEASDDAVREGTGAIRVYQDMIFSDDVSSDWRENRRRLLLHYCRLDTAAMVMIWLHWSGERSSPDALCA